jgi:arylformamidase
VGENAQSKSEGAKVFLSYDQAELDALYDQTKYAPNAQQIHARSEAASDDFRARFGKPERLKYGSAEIEHLDLYKARSPKAPIFIFIHGGSWRNSSASRVGYPGELFVEAGANYIALDFSSVDDVGKNLRVLADQVRRATAWVYRNAERFGGDRDRLFVCGHSSGAHLASVVLTTDWAADFDLPKTLVKGGICCSGMYDLLPVSLTSRSSYVDFSAETIETLSTIRRIAQIHCPMVLAYATLESPEFKRHAEEFERALKAAGKEVRLLIGKSYNHFEIFETLGNPYGLLGRAALDLMRLKPATGH